MKTKVLLGAFLILGTTLQAFQINGWLPSPSRSNSHDPRSQNYYAVLPSTPVPYQTPTSIIPTATSTDTAVVSASPTPTATDSPTTLTSTPTSTPTPTATVPGATGTKTPTSTVTVVVVTTPVATQTATEVFTVANQTSGDFGVYFDGAPMIYVVPAGTTGRFQMNYAYHSIQVVGNPGWVFNVAGYPNTVTIQAWDGIFINWDYSLPSPKSCCPYKVITSVF